MRIINRELPRLRDISRPAAWYLLTFSVFNLLLGASLYSVRAETRYFFIINSFLTYQVWGAIFFFIGVFMLFSYITNRWKLMKDSFILAIFIKLMWAIALIIRQIHAPNTNTFLILLWITIAILQMGAYLYFPTYDKEPIDTFETTKETPK